MTHQQETYLLQQVNKSTLNCASSEIRRFYRKIAVRKLKREYGLPLLDIDNFVHSPYTNRLLKPFIRRDTSCHPLWLKVMEELRIKVNKSNPKWKTPPIAPIDYSYVRPQHIPAINSLCNQFFWPGIDCE